MLAHLGAGACSALFSAWLFRLVPEWTLALWPVCTSLGAMMFSLTSLGTGDYFVRTIPDLIAQGEEEEAGRQMRTALLMSVAVSLPLTYALWHFSEPVARHVIREPKAAEYMHPLVVASFVMALRNRMQYTMTAVQMFGKQAIVRIMVDALRSPLAVLLYLRMGTGGVLLALTIVPLTALALETYWLRRYLFGAFAFTSPWRILRVSAPYAGVSLCAFLQRRAHYLVVGLVGGSKALAPYFVAYRLGEYFRSFDKLSIAAVTPKLSERGGSQPEERPRIFAKCTRYVFLALLPFHVAVATLCRPLLHLYGGDAYKGATAIFALLSIGFFAEVVYLLHRAHVQVFGRPVHLLLLQVLSGIVNLLGLLGFVMLLGAVGAAVNVLVTNVCLGTVASLMLRRVMPLRYDRRDVFWAACGSMAVAAVLLGLQTAVKAHLAVVLGLSVIVGPAAYLAVVWHRLTKNDVETAMAVLPATIRRTSVGQGLARLLVGCLQRARS